MFEHLSIFVFTPLHMHAESEEDIHLKMNSVTAWPPSLALSHVHLPSPFSLPLLSLVLWQQHHLLSPSSAAALWCSAHLCASEPPSEPRWSADQTHWDIVIAEAIKGNSVGCAVYWGGESWEIKESEKWDQCNLLSFYWPCIYCSRKQALYSDP